MRRSVTPCLSIGDALDAHAPREALDLLGVIAIVVDVGVDVGVDLAGAEDLEPALSPADVAARAVGQVALPAALKARDVDLDARLGEREEVRAQATSRPSPKIALAKLSSVPLRSASVMSSSTARPSTWWNCGGVRRVAVAAVRAAPG
jgi:hypothetical protein